MFFIINLILVAAAGLMVLAIAATSSLPRMEVDRIELAKRN